MKFIQGTDRHQLTLFPACLEDSVDTDAEVRLIDLFVDSLDINPMGLKWIL
jgi:transposase